MQGIIVVRTATDVKTTSRDFALLPYLRNWATALDTNFVDYVVVGLDNFLSFRKEGYGPLLGEQRQQAPERTVSTYQAVEPEPTPEKLQKIAIGARIKALRTELGMKQKDLAAKAGVCQSDLSNIERGYYKEIKDTVADKIAAALNVHPKEFINQAVGES